MNRVEALKLIEHDFPDYTIIPKIFWSDKEFILIATKKDITSFEYIDSVLKKDREIILSVVTAHGPNATKYLDKSFKSDKEIILKILKKPLNYFSLGDELSPTDYMSKDFLKDEDVISEALNNQWIEYDKIDSKLITKKIAIAATTKSENFEKLNNEFKNDPDVILNAITSEKTWGDSEIFKKISDKLKSEKNFIIKVLGINGQILNQVSDNFKKDKEIVMASVTQSGYALQYAHSSLKKDIEIVLSSIEQYGGSALEYADHSLKINKDLVLNAIKNHKDDRYIDYVDESFLKDKDFIIRAVSLNRKFMSLLSNFDYNFVKDVDIFNLVKEGKAIAKLYSKELYECLKYQLPEHELLCFFWSGGSDSFHGYKLFYEKKTGKEITKTQIEQKKKTIIKELFDDCLIVEEMELELGCTGEFYSQGGLVVALKPLSETFQWNVVNEHLVLNFNELSEHNDIITTINLPKNFTGFSLNGQNSEDLGFDEEKEQTNYDITPVGKQLKI